MLPLSVLTIWFVIFNTTGFGKQAQLMHTERRMNRPVYLSMHTRYLVKTNFA